MNNYIGLPFEELSEWKQTEDGHWFRHLKHAKPSDITGRVAFIEKTPRVRTDFIKNEWNYCDEDINGMTKEWCDYELTKQYTLGIKDGYFKGYGLLVPKDEETYYWELDGFSVGVSKNNDTSFRFDNLKVFFDRNGSRSLSEVTDRNNLILLSWIYKEIYKNKGLSFFDTKQQIYYHLIKHNAEYFERFIVGGE